MNARNIIFTALASASLILTSCSEDGLVSTVEPVNQMEMTNPNTPADGYEPGSSFSATEDYEFTAPLKVSIGKVNPQLYPQGTEGKISIRSKSSSFEYKWGSWVVNMDLTLDENTDQISGTYNCIFPDMADRLELTVVGYNAINIKSDTGELPVYRIVLDVKSNRGTGRFENKVFEGQVILNNLTGKIMPGMNNLPATGTVRGTLADIQIF